MYESCDLLSQRQYMFQCRLQPRYVPDPPEKVKHGLFLNVHIELRTSLTTVYSYLTWRGGGDTFPILW